MKSNSNERPPKVQALGNGRYYYNFHIVEVEREEQGPDRKQEKRLCFDYESILIAGTPNYRKAVEARIRDKYTATQEFDLINSYNAAVIEGDDASQDVEKYKAYLSELQTIKAEVAQDFEK